MKKKSSRNNFIIQGGILGIAGILTRIIGMFYRIPVTNIIGPKGNGYYAAAYQIYTIMLLISSYSLPLAVSKLVSARIGAGEYKNADRIFRGAFRFAACTGGFVCLLILIGADFFATHLMSESMSGIALKVFAPTLLTVALMGVIRGYFQGMGTMIPTAVSQIVEQIVNAVISILAAKYLFVIIPRPMVPQAVRLEPGQAPWQALFCCLRCSFMKAAPLRKNRSSRWQGVQSPTVIS